MVNFARQGRMNPDFVRVPLDTLRSITDTSNERNIYVHPNPLAREIFWQRLTFAYRLLCQHVKRSANTLDFGGGSGAFLPSLCGLFDNVSVIDLDLTDAKRIADHYDLINVQFLEQDITKFGVDVLFDLVVATDVFEHFEDMQVPWLFLQKHLKVNGLLLLTLPTENLLYELGRKVVRKSKPLDHYHSANDLVSFYRSHGYELLDSLFVPRLLGLAAPLFFVGLFRRLAYK